MLGQLRPWGGADPTSPEVVDKEEARHLCPRITGAKGVNERYA